VAHGEPARPSTAAPAMSPSGNVPPPVSAIVGLLGKAEASEEGRSQEGRSQDHASCFSLLGYDTLLILMESLHREADVRALACTCKHLAGMADDGMLWRTLFAKHYPQSELSVSSMHGWKYACQLELSSNAHQLTCFHTKATLGAHDEQRGRAELFGIPITFTANPRTREVDYVYSTMETLSFSAFTDDGVRRTVWGERFTHFLPMYLNATHFEAALPVITRTLRSMANEASATTFGKGGTVVRRTGARNAQDHSSQSVSELALDLLPKLLCTTVVLLADKGVAASDPLLDGYCQIYRLLLALAQRYPSMRTQVSQRLQRFVREEGARTKAREPSLGVFVPLLALANGLRWSELAWPLLHEAFDRGVLWACRDHPELAEADGCDPEQRLQWSWEGRRVACRLLAFHYGFLSRFAKVTSQALDQFSGNPTPWLRVEMRSHTAKVLAADTWPAFFDLIHVPCPSKASLNAWLLQSVTNSERKGYHARGMDFSRVQRSGVSTILRKGDSVSASATMRRIRLEQVWRWRGDTLFLDASCLTYGWDGKRADGDRPQAVVDFNHTRSVSGLHNSGQGVYGRGGGCAISHSGDVIRAHKSEGSHTIDVNLRQLSDQVSSLYITLSAWTTPLSSILRPEVRCYDPDDQSGEPLARYELDGKLTGESTAVVMARVWRSAPGARWNVTAIGELGMGRASDYGPIEQIIANYTRANLH